jgi:hypothetical protein
VWKPKGVFSSPSCGGSVRFSTTTVAMRVFVIVHVRSSPGARVPSHPAERCLT